MQRYFTGSELAQPTDGGGRSVLGLDDGLLGLPREVLHLEKSLHLDLVGVNEPVVPELQLLLRPGKVGVCPMADVESGSVRIEIGDGRHSSLQFVHFSSIGAVRQNDGPRAAARRPAAAAPRGICLTGLTLH